MRVITTHINKGGTGKSTVSYNFAKWLADEENKKVLLIDGDRSLNLSYSFSNLIKDSIYDVFNGKEVEFTSISKNLDFLRGSELLEDNTMDLKSRQNNTMIFYMWIADNFDRFKQYDYMVIDTHNDNSLVTANFLAVADDILAVSEPSRNGFRAWHELIQTVDRLKSEVIDPITRVSYISCEPYLIANKVSHIGNSSKQYIEAAENEAKYLGMIQDKELMKKSLLHNKSIFEMKHEMTFNEYRKHEKFYENVEKLFNKIIEII